MPGTANVSIGEDTDAALVSIGPNRRRDFPHDALAGDGAFASATRILALLAGTFTSVIRNEGPHQRQCFGFCSENVGLDDAAAYPLESLVADESQGANHRMVYRRELRLEGGMRGWQNDNAIDSD